MVKGYFLAAAAIISGLGIPISTALQNIGAALLIISFLFFYKRNEVNKIWSSPFPATGLLLGVALAVGTLWSNAGLSASWGFVWKLHAYYLIPIFFVVLAPKKYRDYFLIGFTTGTLLSVALSCVFFWLNISAFEATSGDWAVFRTHTYHNFFAAVVGIGILATLLSESISRKSRLLLIFFFIFISYDILFLVNGRTGQIIFVIMIIFSLLLWNWKRGIIFGSAIIVVLSFILPLYSPAYIQGMNNAKSDLSAFSEGNARTSLGLRWIWHKNSVDLIKEKPWIGHGTGSFKSEFERIVKSKDNSPATENPHNDYLWLSVDLGLFGGLLLVGILLSAAWQGRHLMPAWRWTLFSLLLGMGVSTLANSFFTDNISGLAFVLLTCALLNGPKKSVELYA